LLWTRGLAKLETPETLTDAEREVLELFGGTSIRAQLAAKALTPAPPTPAPAPVVPTAASRAWVKKALEAYTEGLSATLKQTLAQRDAKIKALEDRLVALEADQAVKRELVP